VVELLESGVDVSCRDGKKRTALHFSASQGNDTIGIM
jgi:ankyrin repeat protein